ncbi:SAM-dependent methyltransferase [Microbacterium sp. H1-D42]|uniref:SAM-dependent methyltransferase n=1 Tax=Microbacterium sp. H1-D42 TaxID=2925844 RepID=UPI001F538C37|nr:SAM-dependent methyltransferase [Microbacterium sp. H1-D42]UNK72441.1 SAM-dependent methyltransferase [Microbacterium sp. H1-D42]
MHPALFYRPGERLSLSELGAARLDGQVTEVGEGFMPIDTVEDPAARAMSIAALLPERTAASGPTAAWVHGAGDRPPGVHHATRNSPSRLRAHSSARVVYHDRCLAADEVEMIGPVAVTTRLATAVTLLFDLAREGGDEKWLRDLLSTSPGLGDAMRTHVASIAHRPGSRKAKQLLAELLSDQDVVTR